MLDRMHDIWVAASRRYRETEKSRETSAEVVKGKAAWTQAENPDRLATRLIRKGMHDAMALSLVRDAEADLAMGNKLLERIIEDSELLDISFLTRGAVMSRAVARVQIRSNGGSVRGHGTGFLVSPGLLMTNNHVLSDRDVAAVSVAQFDYVASPAGLQPRIEEFRFDPDRFFRTSRELDFTLVAVAPSSDRGTSLASRPWTALIRESGKVLIGEPVNIIQHPGGETMKIACRQNKLVNRLENFLHYVTDTERGSSGSAVCNDSWELAALHHAGVPESNQRGQILLQNGSVWNGQSDTAGQISWIANEGVRVSRIVEHLDGLTLTPDEKALYLASFEPFDPSAAPPPEAVRDHGSDGPFNRREADGSVSWYFRVNFGPAGALPQEPADVSPAPAGTVRPGLPSAADMHIHDRALAAATGIVERFRPDQPYYDAPRDRQAAASYYGDTDLQASPAALYRALHDLTRTSHTTVFSYRTARTRHLYPWVDLHEDGSLRNIYSGLRLDPVEVIAEELERYERFRPGFLAEFSAAGWDDQEPEEEAELLAFEDLLEAQAPFNCEHVVPQSWFDKQQPMKADLHHLFTCEPRCNSFRSNNPYFDFDPLLGEDPELDIEIVRGECGQLIEKKFEPQQGHGTAARATLYFLLRYPGQIGDKLRELQKERVETLLRWHETDAPRRYEKHRNAAIHAAQGNRNPLIDFPDLGRKIDFNLGFSTP